MGVAALPYALLLFALINYLTWQLFTARHVHTNNMMAGADHTEVMSEDWFRQKRAPDVVLLGSSLMLFPFWAMDKEKHVCIPDLLHYRDSIALAGVLARHGFTNPTVFNMAGPLQMVSDSYILTDQLLCGKLKPKCIILGIAPRDFCDFDLPTPISTSPARRLITWSNFGRYADLYLPNFMDRVELACNTTCNFYAHRRHTQRVIEDFMDRTYQRLRLPCPNGGIAVAGQGALQILAGDEEYRWKNSEQEYKMRYRQIEKSDLSTQLRFLLKLNESCNQRNIKLIVVNLPLSEVNRKLLPPGFYQRFCDQVGTAVRGTAISYVDLALNQEFTRQDFFDTSHLCQTGGRKLLAHLEQYLKP